MDTQEIALVRDDQYTDTVVHKIVVIDIPYQEMEGKAALWGYARLSKNKWSLAKYAEDGSTKIVHLVDGLARIEKYVRAELG